MELPFIAAGSAISGSAEDLVCTVHVCFLLFSKCYSITDVSHLETVEYEGVYTNTVPMRT